MATKPVTSRSCAEELLETIPLVMHTLRQEMRKWGTQEFSVAQFRALVFVRQNHGASLGDVASFLGVAQPTASAIVNRLVNQGLMTREPHASERRRVALGLTESGEGLVTDARRAAGERFAAVLTEFRPEELELVQSGLSLLRDAFGGRRGNIHEKTTVTEG
jgi:MarR family transcriptional regulator, organic hydroperoxide resistance regulator